MSAEPHPLPDGRWALPGNRWDLLDGMRPSSPPLVSVIVAHYRQPEQLARTLAALQRQDHPADRLQIIVADDGSPEMPAVPPGVELVRQDDAGFRLAAVRNLGARRARGEVLVFLDADTAPEPAFIREVSRLPSLAPDCVTVGRRRHADLAGVDAARLTESARERELPEPGWLRDAYRDSGDLLRADDRSYRFVIGAVIACSRVLFDATGGFDESFSTYGGEDWEWVYRAWLCGGVLAHVPTAVAWHDGPDVTGRPSDVLATKNAEALRMADLIPLPGSAGRGIRPSAIDIAVALTGPDAAIDAAIDAVTPGQAFVSVDSAVAAVERSRPEPADPRDPALRRSRLRIELLRPVRVAGPGLAAAVERVVDEQLGMLTLHTPDGVDLVRIVALRARARSARWGRDDLFPAARAVVDDISAIRDEVDVQAYLGGWG